MACPRCTQRSVHGVIGAALHRLSRSGTSGGVKSEHHFRETGAVQVRLKRASPRCLSRETPHAGATQSAAPRPLSFTDRPAPPTGHAGDDIVVRSARALGVRAERFLESIWTVPATPHSLRRTCSGSPRTEAAEATSKQGGSENDERPCCGTGTVRRSDMARRACFAGRTRGRGGFGRVGCRDLRVHEREVGGKVRHDRSGAARASCERSDPCDALDAVVACDESRTARVAVARRRTGRQV